ncbi:MAG: ATP-binding protein [Bacteroidetes bacterium]|nr:ATP-binding protein [Bacteroidota bacterium]
MNLIALNLISKQNPVTEDRYYQIVEKLRSDSILKKMLIFKNSHEHFSDSLNIYLKQRYFKDYWRRYNIQVTFCKPQQELSVQPQEYVIDCNHFFQNLIKNYGETTSAPGLYYLDFGYGKEYYLALLNTIESNATTEKQAQLYIEFTLPGIIPDPGYPGLLLDENWKNPAHQPNYTYALYQYGRLVHSVGNCNYLLELETYPRYSRISPYFFDNNLKHFHFRINEGSDLLISKTSNGFFSEITPFSYLFIIYSCLALIIKGFSMVKKGISSNPVDLRTKLQIYLTNILILTMVIIGILQVIYIIKINEMKKRDYLREKAYSLLTEVQDKFSASGTASDVINQEPENFLIKLSNIFFCDINLYDTRGFLISSSRKEIFAAGLISERINALAYKKMIIEHNSILIHEEVIGNMKFGSVYLPMHNNQGNLLGYINLPYFARLDDLKKEISSFLVTFVNIYILIILSGALISFLLSNYITSPLALLSTKMSLLRLGKPNEKISWKINDEIGRLVSDYNRMIDELDKSVNQLALNERESAWREMARQVAHEIKNPLTPMKLSAQYLQKSWNEHAPDMEQRITRFTKTLVEQIDTLATIASDFSCFAKMSPPISERLNIVEVINTVLTLYQESTNIRYVFESENNTIEILSDRSQLIRVLTNLINNAVQAIGSLKDGLILLSLHETTDQIIIQISDNGIGIPADLVSKIFQPDFTTKTGGMGLGLAIVKGIILDMKGEISFTSNENTGTNFTIRLPIKIKNNDGKPIQI